jgi:hypothetical protein
MFSIVCRHFLARPKNPVDDFVDTARNRVLPPR